MSFTFINNSIVILRGLIWLFIFKSVPLFCCHAEALLHIASCSFHPLSWLSSISVKLRLDHALVYPQPDSEDTCSHTWKTLSNHVFEDLRKPKAPNRKSSRHVKRWLKSVRKMRNSGVISVTYISTDKNLADPFTKGLPRNVIEIASREMGMRPV
jgi:hypothetical protein